MKLMMTKFALSAFTAAFILGNTIFVYAEDTIKTDAQTLCELVAQKKTLAIKYSDDPADGEMRVLQPYGVGYTKRRSTLLFGRQISGYSKSVQGDNPLPGWRNFTLSKIKRAESRGKQFSPEAVPTDAHKFITEFVCKSDVMK